MESSGQKRRGAGIENRASVQSLPRHPGDPRILEARAQMMEYRGMVDRVAEDGVRRVLDWGCGLGHVSRMLRARGLDVTSLEYDPSIARDRPRGSELYPDLEIYVTADPVRLPYDSGRFDAVLSAAVLEHVSDPDGSVEEVRRVLSPGGTFYVYKLPNRWSYLERLSKRIGWYYHGALRDDRLYTVRSARALLERHGFSVREARRMNMLPLTLTGSVADFAAPAVWRVNRSLSAVAGLNAFATNVELVASRES